MRIKNQISLEGWVFLLRAYQSLAEHQNPGWTASESAAADEEAPRKTRRPAAAGKEAKPKVYHKLNSDEHVRAYQRLKTEYDSFYRDRAERAKLSVIEQAVGAESLN
jgi:hypothetical protein